MDTWVKHPFKIPETLNAAIQSDLRRRLVQYAPRVRSGYYPFQGHSECVQNKQIFFVTYTTFALEVSLLSQHLQQATVFTLILLPISKQFVYVKF